MSQDGAVELSGQSSNGRLPRSHSVDSDAVGAVRQSPKAHSDMQEEERWQAKLGAIPCMLYICQHVEPFCTHRGVLTTPKPPVVAVVINAAESDIFDMLSLQRGCNAPLARRLKATQTSCCVTAVPKVIMLGAWVSRSLQHAFGGARIAAGAVSPSRA